MSSPGTFIVSLDCEGKWGMAEVLKPCHRTLITDAGLLEAYSCLLRIFARHDVSATFAFVMAFTLTASERRMFDYLLEPRGDHEDSWMQHYWREMASGDREGWFQPAAFDAVRGEGRHEIACHSFCHRPLGALSATAEQVRAELKAAADVASVKGVSLKTFVFPRNDVGHLPELRAAGFLGYRERLARPGGAWGRLVRLGEELNVQPALQRQLDCEDGLVPIPAGYFLNWRFGARRGVPKSVTLRRWRNLLHRTAHHGTVAHLWLHPHNLLTAPDTAELLDAVLAEAKPLRERGLLRVETQEDYCRRVASSTDDGRAAAGPRLERSEVAPA